MWNLRVVDKKFFPAIILSGVILFFCLTNFIWLWLDTTPPSWDAAGHMNIALRIYKLSKVVGPWQALKLFLPHLYAYHPPFFYLVSQPFIYLLGFHPDTVVTVNFLFIALLVYSVYGIGRLLFSKKVGILSAILVLFYPIAYALSREYWLDFALMAMVASAEYLILRSAVDTTRRWHLLLGLALGLTLLTKAFSVLFLVPALGYYFFLKRKNLSEALLVLEILLTIAAIWYIPAFERMIYFKEIMFREAMLRPLPSGFSGSLSWYYRALFGYMLSPTLFWFLIIGTLGYLLFNRRLRPAIFLLLWVIPATIGLALIPAKDARFMMPILPALATTTAAGMESFRPWLLRVVLLVSLFFFALIQFIRLSFGLDICTLQLKKYELGYNRTPEQKEWHIREIIRFIGSRAGGAIARPVVIENLANLGPFNDNTFRLYLNMENLPFQVLPADDYLLARAWLKDCAFVISKSPPMVSQWDLNISIARLRLYDEFFSSEEKYNSAFLKGLEVTLPDQSLATVFMNKKLIH